jgi:hypothetical protein
LALSGSVKALVQANNGHVLAGTNNSARIYRSTNNGQTWTQIIALGTSSDSVNAFAKILSSGYILAAVTGSSTAQGIWRSIDNGATWTKVKSHPMNIGYNDITAIQSNGRLVAVSNGITDANTMSPVIFSRNNGTTWENVSVVNYTHPHLSVAAYDTPVLFTQYPGEPYGGVFTFYGTDTYYTAMGGVSSSTTNDGSWTNQGFGTVGGGAGNGGLDMISFLIKDTSGNFRRRALWAVKSHLNVANTELWQWPATPTGPYSFAKIATVTGDNFNVMYTDPLAYAQIGAQRTIWAGANGRIYVSYNSGLTWAIATEAPTGQIYSFVRTTSGVLIAGGAAGEIFLFGGTGSEGGGGEEEPIDPEEPVDPTPPPAETGASTSKILGRAATCDDEIFIANKFSFANITHAFHYNGSTYSNLQFADIPPYNILGTTASVNKALYLGSKTNDANVPGGTFSSAVFDITQKSENITVVWEYWNGSTWTALTVQDNTDQFKIEGVNSVSWLIPSAWATTTVNSVVGYWVRARTSAVASNPVLPIHDNRFIYTSLLPYIEIAASQVQGDLPAVGRIKWMNQSGIDIERSVYGLRSLDRGLNFNAFLNISDQQVPFGLTITKGTEAGVAWQADKSAPAGRSLLISYSSSGDLNDWNDLVSITLSTSVAREYHGYYKAMLRCFYNNASSQAWNLRIQLRFGSGGTKTNTQSAYATTLSNWEAVDLGQLAISTQQISSSVGSLPDEMKIVVQGYCTALSKPLTLYDLILIPIDEWAIDARIPELAATGSPEIDVNDYLDIDSISNPKVAISAYNRNPAGQIISRYQNVSNGPVIFQKNKDQRLWFANLTYENYWRGYPETIGSVQIFKQQQYLGYRGES